MPTAACFSLPGQCRVNAHQTVQFSEKQSQSRREELFTLNVSAKKRQHELWVCHIYLPIVLQRTYKKTMPIYCSVMFAVSCQNSAEPTKICESVMPINHLIFVLIQLRVELPDQQRCREAQTHQDGFPWLVNPNGRLFAGEWLSTREEEESQLMGMNRTELSERVSLPKVTVLQK